MHASGGQCVQSDSWEECKVLPLMPVVTNISKFLNHQRRNKKPPWIIKGVQLCALSTNNARNHAHPIDLGIGHLRLVTGSTASELLVLIYNGVKESSRDGTPRIDRIYFPVRPSICFKGTSAPYGKAQASEIYASGPLVETCYLGRDWHCMYVCLRSASTTA